MTSSPDKPMLGGCCVCLDERGWAENPLVYCDGQGCSIAVHQACYGIVSVPSGPWFCKKCENQNVSGKAQCVLCPHQDGAVKKTDSGKWAHVVCALYIPEVEFGNVTTMEPIVLEKIPADRYEKICYVCEENKRSAKSAGACMDCAKTGCKLSFHVTCAQMSGLLCEEAGGSNTTKYCGYCSQHFSKHKKSNQFKSLACSRVYKLPSSSSEAASPEKTPTELLKTTDVEVPVSASSDKTPNNNISQDVPSELITSTPESKQLEDSSQPSTSESNVISPLSTLAEVAACAYQEKEKADSSVQKYDKTKSTVKKEEGQKKTKRKNTKNQDGTSKKVRAKKPKVSNDIKPTKVKLNKSNKPKSEFETSGYAAAPKHSVVTLSAFGEDSLEPSHPSDIGETKPSPMTQLDCDGLTAIQNLVNQQKNDVLQFFQEFGTSPNVASLLQTLQSLREENSHLEKSVERMTHRRDQLLAIKARLSVPLKTTQFSRACSSTPDRSKVETKPFNSPPHAPVHPAPYPYYANKN